MQLNGWRRLWVVWAVVSLPLVIVGTLFLMPSAEEYWRNEYVQAAGAASQRAIERLSGPKKAAPVTEADLQQHAKEQNAIISNVFDGGGDDQLRADLASIEAEYQPKIDDGRRLDRIILWVGAPMIWLLLVRAAYVLGAIVAWVRQGFRKSSGSPPAS